MGRKAQSLSISLPLPKTLSPFTVLKALHSHEALIANQAYVTNYKLTDKSAPSSTHYPTSNEVPTPNSNSTSDPPGFFEPNAEVSQYDIVEAIPIVAGIGSMGQYSITFPGRLQNTVDGVRAFSAAPMGVTVQSQWRVEGVKPGDDSVRVHPDQLVKPEDVDLFEWFLAEDSTTECAPLLMTFVKKTLESAHRDMAKKLLDGLHQSQGSQPHIAP